MTADELAELVHRQTEALATLRQQRDAARTWARAWRRSARIWRTSAAYRRERAAELHTEATMLMDERDKAEAERDEARAEVARLRAVLEACEQYVKRWPIGLSIEPQEQPGGPRDFILSAIREALKEPTP